MRRLIIGASIIAIMAGCSGWYVYKDPSQMFSHKVHKEILEDKGFKCLDCHRFLKLKERDIRIAMEFSEIGLYPKRYVCHYCHIEEKTRTVMAPDVCSTCHMNIHAIKPLTHVKDWRNFHAVDARQDKERIDESKDRQSCTKCHREWFCTDCHMRRDTIQTRMHPRPFRFIHSVEAQVDPARCSSCHITQFCLDCHRGKARRYN